MSDTPVHDVPELADQSEALWARLRGLSPARIGLGRVGTALPLAPMLDFQLAHAAARDAVHIPLDPEALAVDLDTWPILQLASAAPDRKTYLRRPDLGRVLDPASATILEKNGCDLVFVVGDGLSATAVQRHAAPLLRACIPMFSDLNVAPIVIVRQARVAIGDPIGGTMGARMSIVVIGERPGLSVSDSLGIYLTFGPRPGRTDAERNCISNIHENGGLSFASAARTLSWLVREGLRRSLTGVDLKDDQQEQHVFAPNARPGLQSS